MKKRNLISLLGWIIIIIFGATLVRVGIQMQSSFEPGIYQLLHKLGEVFIFYPLWKGWAKERHTNKSFSIKKTSQLFILLGGLLNLWVALALWNKIWWDFFGIVLFLFSIYIIVWANRKEPVIRV